MSLEKSVSLLLGLMIKRRVLIIYLFTACIPIDQIPPAGIEVEEKADSIVFAVIGDFGSDSEAEKSVADMVKGWNPDFIITTGDNNYDKGQTSTLNTNIGKYYGDYIYNWDAPEEFQCKGVAWAEKTNRFFPSPGNHDINSIDGIRPYLNYFTLPGNELFYEFRWGPVSFYSLNSTEENMNDQHTWLEEHLACDNALFHLVYFHHSPYTPGPHGNTEKMQWDFQYMGVDAVLTGHDHLYARMEKINEPLVHYLISGAGGKSLYQANNAQLDPAIFKVFSYDQNYGAIKGSCSANRLLLQYFSIDNIKLVIDEVLIEP